MASESQSISGQPALLILADDLTGANDVGAQFAKRGIGSIVLVEPEVTSLPSGYEVVVVNTESRHVAPEIAAERVRRIAKLGRRAGARYFFKKTDSTLRGNIGAELQALMETLREKTIPFVPAFPETGRTTRGGIHYVHGIPVAETEFAQDPRSPVTQSEVALVLRSTCNMKVTAVGAGDEVGSGCLVFDCESREEMNMIARRLARENRLPVLAGSAAFAEELPNVLPLSRAGKKAPPPRRPILLVNGSLNPRSLEQVAAGRDMFVSFEIYPDFLLDKKSVESVRLPDRILKENLLLYSARKRGDSEWYKSHAARHYGIAESEVAAVVANNTGELVKRVLQQHQTGTLVVFGGDTLQGITRALRWKAFVPSGEIAPGVTVATPLDSDLTVISKAGGFGDRNIVATIARWVEERSKAGKEL